MYFNLINPPCQRGRFVRKGLAPKARSLPKFWNGQVRVQGIGFAGNRTKHHFFLRKPGKNRVKP
jgi:hypothetical protein